MIPITAAIPRYGAKYRAASGKERKREPDETVRAHLQQHARQNDRARRRRLHVGVGQPRVKWEHGHLDRERHRKCEEAPELQRPRNLQRVQLQQVEARQPGRHAVVIAERQDGDEHEHAAGHRVEHEFDGGVYAIVVSPDPNQEIHRDEHRVPEHVEQEKVERDEHADHRRLEREHEHRECLHTAVDRLPRGQQRERGQESRQHDQEQADAVDADEVVDAERRDPGVALHELKIRRRGVEPRPQQQRARKHGERHHERHALNERFALAPDQSDGRRAGERNEHERGQQRKHQLHR